MLPPAHMLPKPLAAAADATGAIAIVAVLAGYLSPLAALAALVWYIIQIKESKTVQDWLLNHKGTSFTMNIFTNKWFHAAVSVVALSAPVVASAAGVELPQWADLLLAIFGGGTAATAGGLHAASKVQ